MNTPSNLVQRDHRDGLRPYQRTAVELIVAELSAAGRAHLALPTGTGKSRVLVAVARRCLDTVPTHPGTVLVVSPRTQITDQLAKAMRGTGHTVAALPGRGPVDATIVVGSATALRRWAHRTAASPALVLVDEAHHATADGCRALLDDHPNAQRVGVTATPYRHDGARLTDVLGRCVYVRDPDHPDLAGVLAPVTWSAVPLPVSLRTVPTGRSVKVGVDYQSGALGAVLTTRDAITATVAGTTDAIRHRRTLVFAATIEHGQDLADGYRLADHGVGEVYSHTPPEERQQLIERLTLGPDHPDGLGVLVNVTALTEGFDCPPVSALVIARPTRSELLYTQMIGRGLRTHPGKLDCLVFDITGADDPATPTATGQVFAPTILATTRRPDITVDTDPLDVGADRDTDAPWWSDQSRPVRQLIGTDRRSPIWSWSPGPDGTFTVPLSDGRTGVLVPDDGDSGLWTPVLVGAVGDVVGLADPLPARYAVDAFAGMEDRHLTRSTIPWRDTPATEKQLTHLRRLDPEIGAHARAEGWSRGRVSDLLSSLTATRRLRQWTPDEVAS